MIYSTLTQKCQTTIPQEIRKFLHLHEGDRVGFEIIEDHVVIKKILPLDIEFVQALESTLSEWSSKEDDEAYRDL